MNRLRLFIILGFVVVIILVGLAFVLPNLTNNDDTAQDPASTQRGDVNTPAPNETQLPTDPPVIFAEIVVAEQNLPRGAIIPPDAVGIRRWPAESIPVTALTSLEEVIGQRARQDIYQEQPILDSMVVPDLSQLGNIGSDLSASLPPGTRAVAVPIDRLTSVAYGLQRGDTVDIIISLLFVEIDEEFQTILPNRLSLYTINEDGRVTILSGVEGRFELVPAPPNTANISSLPIVVGPRESPRPRLATQMTIQDALVMGVGDFPEDGILYRRPTPTPAFGEEVDSTTRGSAAPVAAATPTEVQRPDIITLAVEPQEAVVLTYYVESRIPVTFALRSAADTSQVGTEPVTLGYIMDTYNIRLPTPLPYSIEPAIRSIRQLIGGEVIRLSDEEANEGG